MRISTPHLFDSYGSQIRDAQSRYFAAQQQVTTGKAFTNASENPLNAQLSINTRHLKARFEQFDKNLRAAKDYLGNSEQAMSEINSLINQANVYAIQGASSAIDTQSAQSLADQIGLLQDKLLQIANRQGSGGQYVFAGQKSDAKPFVKSGTVAQFNGDDLPVMAEIRSAEYMRTNVAGVGAFVTGLYDALETLKTNVASQNIIQISDSDLVAIKNYQTQATGFRGEIGARLQTVAGLSTENARRLDDLTAEIGDLEEVDLTEAMVRYQQAQNAYTAALQVASQGMQLSLMDFLR